MKSDSLLGSRRHGKKKPKLDSSDESDNESEEEVDGYHQGQTTDAGSTVDEKSHRSLIQSLKSSLKTKRKRFREDDEERDVVDASGKLVLKPSGVGTTKQSFLDLFDDKDQAVLKQVKESIKNPSKRKVKGEVKEKSLSLTTSLEKPAVKRIQREILYNNTSKEISKWNSVVYKNRLADQLVFPLVGGKALKKDAKSSASASDNFVPMTPLEEEIAKLVHGEGYVERRRAEVFGKIATVDEGESYVRTVEEALERHHELARLRALQSYEMAKAKRQGKIKSKKYHRLQRREKIRKQLKEFEELQKTDPEAALVKLEELDRARVEERMSLKHRNTSKWAKAQVVRAKYNRESRAELSEQLKISKELTTKLAVSSDESDPDDIDLELPSLVKSSLDNPWCLTGSLKDNDKVNLYYTGYRKFWDDVNERKERERKRAEREEERQKKLEENEKRKQAQLKVVTGPAEEENDPDPDPAYPLTPPPGVMKKVKRRAKAKKNVKIPQAPLVSAKDVPQELSVDDLDELLLMANQKLKEKMKKEVKRLGNKKKPNIKKNRKGNEDDSESENYERRNRRNQDGDADEIRDLNTDDREINFEGRDPESEELVPPLQNIPSPAKEDPKKPKTPEPVIDPAHFLEIRKSTKYDMRETNLDFGDDEILPAGEDEEENEEREHLKMIAEAFEDDDLLGEFERRKADEVEGGKPKEIDLRLPGWGEWGGKDCRPSRKKQKFIKKAPPAPPRKDSALPHVILNEGGDAKVRQHQVKELPFPFTRVADYEKMVRAPVGRTWVPELAMKDLIAPKVITRLGGVIQPISEDVLVKSNSRKSKTLKLIK